jgi:iron complex outermembrane receptor protein
MKPMIKLLLAAGISTLALGAAHAQETPAQEDGIETSNEIVVQGEIGFRNRSDSTEPVLVYDADYFQRFEPLTAGDALKRVPSVTFLSDVIESDGARLRGLDPGYTQILINGEKVPGSQADRSFFLDRIPAELIKQVEIVRSSSARRTGDAVAGTLNIVLRDGYQLDGGYIRAGGLHFDDGEIKPSLGAVYGGALGPGRILLGGNVQGRYNPKKKLSLRYSAPGGTFQNREDQSDVRDGTDYAFNATYDIDGENTDFEVGGFYVRTDRTETERSYEYNSLTAVSGSVRGSPAGALLSDNSNINEIDQENYSLSAKLKQQWSLGKTSVKASFARFWDHQDESENEIDFNRAAPRLTSDLTLRRIVDKELALGVEHQVDLGEGLDLVFGGFFQNKDRDTDITEGYISAARGRNRVTLTAADHNWNQFSRNPDELARPFTFLIAPDGGRNIIEEDRRDGFVLIEGKSGIVSFEAGLRYEHTRVRINDLTVAPALAVRSNDYGILLPSASAKFELTSDDRITISGARTNRRPRLDYLSPAVLLEEYGDNDFRGNPNLKPETAWGFDLGYEHRIGSTGVAGVNLFYRDVTNLTELASAGTGSAGAPAQVLEPRNTGNGKVYGLELDLSSNLGFAGLKDTGMFGNFSWLESDIRDFAGERRFNGQSKFVYNVGVIQNLPLIGAAFGASYRKQGAAYDRIVAEEVRTTYGADLEIFVEKRFGKSFTIRAVGSNLLNAHKDEIFDKFESSADQASRSYDEYEIETEEAGPVFQVMARLAF